VVYVARDVDGSLLPEAEVRQLAKQLPDGVARVMDGQSYVLDDGTIVNENNRGGKSVQGIYLGDPVPCQTRHVG
jgi:hypothetical protein